VRFIEHIAPFFQPVSFLEPLQDSLTQSFFLKIRLQDEPLRDIFALKSFLIGEFCNILLLKSIRTNPAGSPRKHPIQLQLID
jgi:hypothetical protein